MEDGKYLYMAYIYKIYLYMYNQFILYMNNKVKNSFGTSVYSDKTAKEITLRFKHVFEIICGLKPFIKISSGQRNMNYNN
jgi:hypothetical protein